MVDVFTEECPPSFPSPSFPHKIIAQGVCNNLRTPKCKLINGEDILRQNSVDFEIYYGKVNNKYKREDSNNEMKGYVSGFLHYYFHIEINS